MLELLFRAGVPRQSAVERDFEPGSLLARAGSVPDFLYVVARGGLQLTGRGNTATQQLRDAPLLLVELLDQVPLERDVRSHGELTAWTIEARHVRDAVSASPLLLRHVQTLRAIGATHDEPRQLAYHAGSGFELRTAGPNPVRAHWHVNRYAVVARLDNGPPSKPDRQSVFRDAGRDIRRRLHLLDRRVVALELEGPWDELERTLRVMEEGTPVPDAALEAFSLYGNLFELPKDGASLATGDLVCDCLELTRGDIEAACGTGPCSLDDVAKATGATTMCGGCAARVVDLVGSAGAPAKLCEVIPHTADVHSFRFRTRQPPPRASPGKHVLLSVPIDGGWAHRPYTLTSVGEEADYFEITVRREEHGQLSRALFGLPLGAAVRLSAPRGTFCTDPGADGTVVCLVGGTGVTPALAMARAYARHGTRRLHLDYCNMLDTEVPFRKELSELAAHHSHISVNFRSSLRTGYLRREQVGQLVQRWPDADFFVCGPPGYVDSVVGHLEHHGAHERTHTEVFGPRLARGEVRVLDRMARWLTAALLAAYVLQALLEVPFPWLEGLQVEPAYRLWSGSALASFVAFQMLLPLFRLERMPRPLRRLYRVHRYAGTCAPVLLYVHATGFGYGYLLLLAAVYLVNAGVGLVDKSVVADSDKREAWARGWLPIHICLSFALIAIALYHVFVVFAFR